MRYCAFCDAPLSLQNKGKTLCRSCSERLRRGREVARKLTPDQKRTVARAAVQCLVQHGRVGVRFLRKNEEWGMSPIDRQPPKEPPPPPHGSTR